MTKGKKWTLRLLGVAALALLIGLCLMGSTMARYTSKGDGSGTLKVALWDVETAELVIDGGKVSPSDEKYGEGTGTDGARENTSGWVGTFTIKNNSDVDALVTFAADNTYTITWPDTVDAETGAKVSDNWTWGSGWQDGEGHEQTDEYGGGLMLRFGAADADAGKTAFESVVNEYDIFSLTFGHTAEYNESEGDSEPESPTDASAELTSTELSQGVAISAGYSMDIYAEVVWTSIDGGSDPIPTSANEDDPWTSWEEYSDAVDTILGMYAQKLTFGVTWTAVQASTLPPEG